MILIDFPLTMACMQWPPLSYDYGISGKHISFALILEKAKYSDKCCFMKIYMNIEYRFYRYDSLPIAMAISEMECPPPPFFFFFFFPPPPPPPNVKLSQPLFRFVAPTPPGPGSWVLIFSNDVFSTITIMLFF